MSDAEQDAGHTVSESAPGQLPAELLDVVPPELAAQVADNPEAVAMVRAVFEAHSGPLPSPRALDEYERILPGAAERVFTMTEREQAHRHKVDTRFTVFRFSGLVAGFSFAVFAVAATLYLAIEDKSAVALAMVLAETAVIVVVLVTGRHRSYRS